ncbi:MAG: hypothetical protein BWY09_00946 [Candidatus Hydrogenedentes bacterium ADurb.Bin179]|nr:MAG: hypothetical protein BWY09_00946 [Candidatus Hydrogenedentes bacterium ADurb.Bin179]
MRIFSWADFEVLKGLTLEYCSIFHGYNQRLFSKPGAVRTRCIPAVALK